MTKVPFIAALAAMSLAACSEDEPVSVNTLEETPIDFRPAMGSRATETTNANLESINVTSFIGDANYFTKIDFNKGTDGFFTSTDKYYWPGDTTTLSFYAFSPNEDGLGADVTMTADTKTVENFSVPEQIADQIDFVTAYATGRKDINEKSGVQLDFKHQLAQIEIRAKSANQNYVYKVAGARIGRVEYLANFDFTTEKWTLDDWHDTAIYDASCDTVTLSADPVDVMGTAGNAMLMPQSLTPWSPKDDPDNVARESYLSILVRIASKDGAVIYPFPSDTQKDATGNKRQFAWASIPLSGTWEAGKKYVYTLDLTDGAGNVDPDDPQPGTRVLGDPIKYTVNVEDWIEADQAIPMPGIRTGNEL